tara:strand:+ start:1381 stop:2175 length:795 start_codon:yes stop_codon:yes gene_type:complete
MGLSFILPNKKEVLVNEIVYKDLRKISLYRDASITGTLNFLESFILTKNLNVVEKLFTFFLLREKCIGEQLAVGSKKGNVNIDLRLIIENIGTFDDISEAINVDGIKCVLNYPTKFNVGSTDFLFSLIESLEIDGEQITVSSLSEKEYNEVFNRLPEAIFGYLTDFVKRNKSHFEMLVFEKREDMDIDEIKLNVLDSTLPTFINRLFDCIDGTNYREMLFILCKRIPDVSFLINCTYLEIEDFYKLYADEVEKQNENLQNQNDS